MKIEITQYVIMNKERTKYLEGVTRWVMLSKIAGCSEYWMFRDYLRISVKACEDAISWMKYYSENSNLFSHLKSVVEEGFYIKPITVTVEI